MFVVVPKSSVFSVGAGACSHVRSYVDRGTIATVVHLHEWLWLSGMGGGV